MPVPFVLSYFRIFVIVLYFEIFSLNSHYQWPQVLQVVALQELHTEPFELENSPSLLWLKAERSFLTFLPLQVGQVIFWFPRTRTSNSLSHFIQ